MKVNLYRNIIVVLIFIATAGSAPQNDKIGNIVRSVQQQCAPDKRTSVFDISYKIFKDRIVLTGEVDDPAFKTAVIEKLRNNIKKSIIDSINVLPETGLGQRTKGLISVTIADVKHNPENSAELITQALMGTAVKILKRANGFFYIQLPDHYLGWADTTSVLVMNQTDQDGWDNSSKVIVTVMYDTIRQQPDPSSQSLYEVIIGCIIKTEGTKDGWRSVILAGGQKGFISDSSVQDLDIWNRNRQLTSDNLEKTAMKFLGIPYLWGGVSVKGMDCAGFTKTVYILNGFELYRDSDQQAKQGNHILPGKNLEKLRKGDLLFFGKKATAAHPEHITHVGLFLEDGLFIHSSKSKCVRYSSFNRSSKYYEPYLLKIFVRARRLF